MKELELKSIITERWLVRNCFCGAEPEIHKTFNYLDHRETAVHIRCPRCGARTCGKVFYWHDRAVSDINAEYKATIEAITEWENMEQTTDDDEL